MRTVHICREALRPLHSLNRISRDAHRLFRHPIYLADGRQPLLPQSPPLLTERCSTLPQLPAFTGIPLLAVARREIRVFGVQCAPKAKDPGCSCGDVDVVFLERGALCVVLCFVFQCCAQTPNGVDAEVVQAPFGDARVEEVQVGPGVDFNVAGVRVW